MFLIFAKLGIISLLGIFVGIGLVKSETLLYPQLKGRAGALAISGALLIIGGTIGAIISIAGLIILL